MRRTGAHGGVDGDDVRASDPVPLAAARQVVIASRLGARIMAKEVGDQLLSALNDERWP